VEAPSMTCGDTVWVTWPRDSGFALSGES
jgi:hypothetical protein